MHMNFSNNGNDNTLVRISIPLWMDNILVSLTQVIMEYSESVDIARSMRDVLHPHDLKQL